jgi:uncharacterized membrane protein (DUF2068 family)
MIRFLASVTFLSGVTSFFGGVFAIYAAPLAQGFGITVSSFFALVGLMLVGGLINMVLGVGLWRYQNWARVIVIANSLIGLVLFVPELFSGKYTPLYLFTPVISLVIVWYLTFNHKVVEAFRARSHSETNATLIIVAILVGLLANSYVAITKIWPSTNLSTLRSSLLPTSQPR